jgi:hypothetical protein
MKEKPDGKTPSANGGSVQRLVRPRPPKLQELRDKISAERRFVGRKPYSHNIVSLLLQQIASEFGQPEANVAVRELKLKPLGWHEVD